MRAWNAENPDRVRAHNLKKNYDITHAQYEELLLAQGGVCAICSGPPNGRHDRFHIDHDSVTGGVRGLLCSKCNLALGLIQEDDRILVAMLRYLEVNQARGLA